MEEEEIVGLIMAVVLLLLVAVIIVLFTVFLKRKNKLIVAQEKAKKAFERELAETQIEIREETLRNISWELHDNIGQLMTLAKIQVQMARQSPENLDEVAETIGTGLTELRALSKLINPEALKSLSLKEAINLEIERFNRLNFIKSTFTVEGETINMDQQKEIIIFRILQEFFSNTIKHSKASHLDVVLVYESPCLEITAKDDGVGFAQDSKFAGIGLKNMENRAQLIEAQLRITSEENIGTALRLTYCIPQKNV